MKLFKHVEVAIMLAFFLTCAIGALQLGAPGTPSMPLPVLTPVPMLTPMPMPVPTLMPTLMPTPMHMPALMPMPTLTPSPMPVVLVIGRRMTGAEKRAAAASGG